jgi:hypothetical protein
MSENFWADEEQFRDVPDEVSEEAAPPAQLPPSPKQPKSSWTGPQEEPTVYAGEEVDLFPDGDPDEEEDYSAVLSDARLRLEQGKLYELIMNHDLFGGEEADPRAVKHVQREIRKFAKERMEVMLGMRKDTTKVEHLQIDFPFNQVEVDVLKKLAYAASKGASQNSDNYVPKVTKTTQEVDNIPEKKPVSLNPIGVPTKKKPVAPKLPAKPQAPIQRKAAPAPAPQSDEDYEPLKKHPSEMTPEELIERNRQAEARLARNKTVKSSSAMAMPSYEQEEMFHMQRVATAAPAVSAIVAALNQSKKS